MSEFDFANEKRYPYSFIQEDICETNSENVKEKKQKIKKNI